MKAPTVIAARLWEWLHDGDEICVLDVRDGGPYSRSHILVAVSVPLAQFEVLVPRLVPRLTTRIVLCDDDMSMATVAADRLGQNGYTNVHVLDGGLPAWTESGFQLFSGSGIISKAFGELVEHELDTPRIDAQVLRDWHEQGTNFLSFDARPLGEYRTVSLPHATNCPGAELVYRIPAVIDDPSTPIVVNCAGRTRSIIGAQSLRNAGVRNPVYALKNGTMGWQLEGFDTLRGESNMVAHPDAESRRVVQQLARGVADRYGVRSVSPADLAEMQSDPRRTTHVFDVRQADDYEMGHFPGSLHAPGGQLVQATDSYVAVRHARLVLVDEHMVQSVMTAHWLLQMGWEVFVLDAAADEFTERGSTAGRALDEHRRYTVTVSPEELNQTLDTGSCVVIDVGESYWYREGRIPGSYYSMRTRLAESMTRFPHSTSVVVCCGDGIISPFAATDIRDMGFGDVRVLAGGRSGWKRAGFPLERIGEDTDDRVLSETDDMWYPPWARKEGVDEAIMQYLTWETGLLEPVSRETYLSFRVIN